MLSEEDSRRQGNRPAEPRAETRVRRRDAGRQFKSGRVEPHFSGQAPDAGRHVSRQWVEVQRQGDGDVLARS